MAEEVRFQHFEVLRKEDGTLWELGRGAMGITYKAFDTNLRCHVALKVINAAYLDSDVARQRFLREARAAAALRHPNVATVFHLGVANDATDGGNYFYAMEFVDGETVESFMKREGAVPTAMGLEIAGQVCRALAAAQRQGLVHRDIKPSNLMLVREDDDFTVKVIDFGLAKNAGKDAEDTATLTVGGFLGTPHFASPEQLDEREIDVRSDIYSLGVTLWYMLAGKTPFSGSLAQVMSQHLHRDPPFQSLDNQPPPVVALLRKMMAKQPEDRPQTPADVRKEIEHCLAHVRAMATPPPRPAGPVATDDMETHATAVPPQMANTGTVVSSGAILAGRYRLLNEVTASDHGRVFRAERLEDNAVLAVLFLHESLFTSSESFTRLEDDVARLQQLREPAFQAIHSLERTSNGSILVLEWIEGPALLDVLRARRALTLPETVTLLGPLASGFDALAKAGLGCPDIAAHEIVLPGVEVGKPVPAGVVPKFLPLSTSAGAVPDATMVASPFALLNASGAFAANPQAAYGYSVASIAYEMLGGVHTGSSMGAYIPIPGLSEGGNATLRRALNPAEGCASAEAFLAELADASAAAPRVPSMPVRPSPPAAPTPLPRGGKPVLLWVGICAGIVLAVLVGALAIVWRKPAAAPQSPVATPTAAAASPTPTPAETNEETLAVARQLEAQGHLAGAMETYAALAARSPDLTDARDALERIAATLRRQSKPDDDLSAVRQPLAKAAGLNIPSAQLLLGEITVKSDPVEALRLFRTAAEAGNSEAMAITGRMLASGQGTGEPDFAQAAEWFSKSAALENPDGQYAFAECLLFGKGVSRDSQRAIELLQAAAQQQNPQAMNMLGDLFKKGIPGVLTPDHAEAFRLFSRARDLGFLDAQGNLGVLYINGQGVEKDEKMAFGLFQSGAEQGNALCMFFYAMCLNGGVGTEKDPAAAQGWFVKAARGGNKPAADWCLKNNVPLTDSP